MNTELFIAKRIIGAKNNTNAISKPIIKIASLGITLGIVVMILAIAILTGFKKEISAKVIGFGSHIQINRYDSNLSFEKTPINNDSKILNPLKNISEIDWVQPYVTKAGIVKANENIEGILLKGVDKTYKWEFFNDKIIQGKHPKIDGPAKSNEILISKTIAQKLQLKVGNRINLYFFQDPPRQRKLTVSGIYETGMPDFDNVVVIGDIGHIQKLNNWAENQVTGFEVFVKDFSTLPQTVSKINEAISYDLKAESIKDLHPQIFNWLDLQDTNTLIILTLMIIVAGINMISALIILILEKANFIGILKAMGSNNWSIQKIFLYHATYLIGKGMFWGNIIGLAICIIQQQFGIIPLDPETYYLSKVPINLNVLDLVILNIGTLTACLLMLLMPSMLISKILPIRSIKFS